MNHGLTIDKAPRYPSTGQTKRLEQLTGGSFQRRDVVCLQKKRRRGRRPRNKQERLKLPLYFLRVIYA